MVSEIVSMSKFIAIALKMLRMYVIVYAYDPSFKNAPEAFDTIRVVRFTLVCIPFSVLNPYVVIMFI
jgi:hypothetical protein